MAAPVFNGDNVSAATPFYNVKWYGAKGDGVTDDSAHIQNAINAAQTAGGGIVFLPAGTYHVASGLTIGGSNVTLHGAGQDATNIQGPNGATFDILTVAGTGAVPGTISTYSSTCTVRDLTISQALNGTTGASTSNVGIRVQYIIFPKIIDVNVANCGIGLRFTGTVDLFAHRVRQTSSYASVANAYGFYIDGATQNASCYLAECISSFGSFTGTSNFAYYVHGAHLADLYLLRCEGNSSTYGFYYDGGAAAGASDAQDVHFIQLVADQCTNTGINIVNVADNAGMVQVTGAYTSAGADNHIGVNIGSSSGVVVSATELMSSGHAGTKGIALSSSLNCSVVRNVLKGNHAQGIYISGSTDYTIAHNVLTATASTGSSMAIDVAGTSPNGSFIGNIISAASTFQWRYGLYIGSNSDHCVAIGNVFDTAGIFTGSQITFADATNQNWQIANNSGYNPLGGSVAQPGVGASPWSYTNTTGVPLTAYISGGTVSSVSIDGKTTGLTSGSFRVPPGKTLVLTYTVVPTVSVIGD